VLIETEVLSMFFFFLHLKLLFCFGISQFALPNLKVGGLNGLVVLSDDLGKVDVYVENVTRKLASQLYDVVDSKDKFELQINSKTIKRIRCFI
jgi:hypothetical protein